MAADRVDRRRRHPRRIPAFCRRVADSSSAKPAPGPHHPGPRRSTAAGGQDRRRGRGDRHPHHRPADAVLRRLAATQTAHQRPMPPITASNSPRRPSDSTWTSRPTRPNPGSLPTNGRIWALDAARGWTQIGPAVADQPHRIRCWSPSEPPTTNDVAAQLRTARRPPDQRRPHLHRRPAPLPDRRTGLQPWSQQAVAECVVAWRKRPPPSTPTASITTPLAPRSGPGGLADATATADRSREIDIDVATARGEQVGADSWPARVLLIATDSASQR